MTARRGNRGRVRADQFADPPGEDPEIVGRDVGRARVVRGIIGQQCQRLSLGSAHRQDRHRRIDRPGLPHQVGILMAGIHLRLVFPASREGHGERGPGFHDPAAAEDEFRTRIGAPSHLRRPPVGVSLLNGFGDLSGHEFPVFRVRVGSVHAHDRRGGMRVRGGDEHALRGNAGGALGPGLGVIEHVPRDQATVHQANHDNRTAVIQNQGARVQWILHAVRPVLHDASGDPQGQGRGGDIHRGGSRPEHPAGSHFRFLQGENGNPKGG